MQKGRNYRAAIPRSNLYDCAYNSRIPWRWNLHGFLLVGATGSWPVDQPAHLVYVDYFPIELEWRHRGTIVAAGHSIDCKTEFKEGLADGGHRFTVRFDDMISSTMVVVWELPWPTFPVNTFFGWPVGPPNSVTVAGPVFRSVLIRFTAVVYADEP